MHSSNTCDMYMCRLRHISDSVLSSLKMEGICLLFHRWHVPNFMKIRLAIYPVTLRNLPTERTGLVFTSGLVACTPYRIPDNHCSLLYEGVWSGIVVKALRYSLEGPGIDPRLLGIFSGASDSSMCPGVDSASRNEYQDIPGGKDGRCVRARA
jgi:hypothetical protein